MRFGWPGFSRLWLLVAILTVLVMLFPIKTGFTRTSEVAALVFLWIYSLVFAWRLPVVRWGLLALPAIVLAVCLAPGRPFDSSELTDEYVGALKGYGHTAYVWGGENSIGIDCSGLVREGLVDATWHEGLKTLNPRLLRESFFIWWHDCTANELGQGYRGRTEPVTETESLQKLDYRLLRPGDIAVTASGVHTLAYLGTRTWIEADPGSYRVVQVTVPQSQNMWLRVPMTILRWKILGAGSA